MHVSNGRCPHRWVLAAACLLAATAGQAWAGDFSFGGKVFADFSSQQQNDHVAQTSNRDWNGDLKRLYLDADYAFDSNWSMHLTTDVNWLRDQSVTDVWVRHLYVQRKFAGGTTLRIGVNDMPMMSLTSKWYGYRYVDPIGSSMAKIDSSADWGVHLNAQAGANVDVAVAVVSGGGYKQPRTGDRADVEAVVAWHPDPRAVIAVGGYDGQLAAEGTAARPLYHTARRADFMAAWTDDTWRFGARYAYGSNWANLYTVDSERTRNVSVWASRQLTSKWSVFTRFDTTWPRLLHDSSRKNRYANAGVEYRPRKGIRLALVGKHTTQHRQDNLLRSGNEIGIWSEWLF